MNARPAGLAPGQLLHIARQHWQSGRAAQAEALCRRLLGAQSDFAPALHLLATILASRGKLDQALALARRSTQSDPGVAVHWAQVGALLGALGRAGEAIAPLRKALEIDPLLADAWNDLGAALRQSGDSSVAISAWRNAVAAKPDHADAWSNLGRALLAAGEKDAALAALERSLSIRPDSGQTLDRYGLALKSAGRFHESLEAHRKAVALKPDCAAWQSNLGVALSEVGLVRESMHAHARAITLNADAWSAWFNFATATKRAGELDEAVAAFTRAIELNPSDHRSHANLGNCYKDLGRLDEAIACFRRSLALEPTAAGVQSNIAYTVHFHAHLDARQILEVNREWARQHADGLTPKNPTYPNDRNPDRRLRIGYVSPDFRRHAAACFLWPLLQNHDPSAVEIFCYSGVTKPDDVTEKLRASAHVWRDVGPLMNDALANLIREDQIDVLVDCTLHMSGSRLQMFARKPAPVQVTWLGYPGTTGLAAMDYRLTDPWLDPPGQFDEHYGETSVRLPHTFWCYAPMIDTPEVNPLPALRNGYITFGCFNSFGKVTPMALSLWRRVMAAIEHARLILQAPKGATRDAIRAIFEGGGVSADRIEFVGSLPEYEYFSLYHRVDVVLDPAPYTGHTTGLDGLWMGVPAVTLRGRTAVARGGASIAANAGLFDWIADDAEHYIAIAQSQTADFEKLSVLRQSLRSRMQESPLTNARQFAADMEGAFQTMWRKWISGNE